MKNKDFRGDLLTHRAEAQMLAATALRQVFPLLPQWGLQNDDWVGPQIARCSAVRARELT